MVADLRSVCGHTRIAPRPTSDSFRYLGVMLSPDLDWTDELARLNSIVWSARSSILNYRMRFLPAADAVRSYVVPRMEAGLQTIGLSARVMATLDRWTGLLQSAVLVAHSSYDPGVCRAAFCFVSGCLACRCLPSPSVPFRCTSGCAWTLARCPARQLTASRLFQLRAAYPKP